MHVVVVGRLLLAVLGLQQCGAVGYGTKDDEDDASLAGAPDATPPGKMTRAQLEAELRRMTAEAERAERAEAKLLRMSAAHEREKEEEEERRMRTGTPKLKLKTPSTLLQEPRLLAL